MKTHLTTRLIADLEERTEALLIKAIQWQTLSNAAFSFSPSPEKWSAAQCLTHLNSYGNYYLPCIEKAIVENLKTEAKNEYKSTWLGNYFYQLMLPQQQGKKLKKMKSPKDHVPEANGNVAEVLAEFIDQLERLLVLLEKAKTINIAKAKVPISIAKFIKLQLGDVFLFVIAHIERHVLQAERMMDEMKNAQDAGYKMKVA
jgi:hypothetical protein